MQYKKKNIIQTVTISEEARDIIARLLNKNPKKRLGFQSDFKEIVQHPWFKEIDFQKLLLKSIRPKLIPVYSAQK